MRDEHRQPPRSVDAGNVPGNPLRSFRMSMLAHGYVDDTSGKHVELDESSAISYSPVRIRRESPPVALWLTAILLIALLVMAVFALT